MRAFSTFVLCCEAKFLKALATSRSTVAVALGTPSGLTCGDAVRLAEEDVVATAFGSGVAVKLDSVVVGGVETSGFAGLLGAGTAFGFSVAGLSGRASCEEMMAGSTGAPVTVDCPVGARLAGGVYLLLDEVKGGKSCCLRTPLYLYSC